MADYWMSSPRMTVLVTVNDRGIITDAAHIVRGFVGRPLVALRRWLEGHGGEYREERLGELPR